MLIRIVSNKVEGIRPIYRGEVTMSNEQVQISKEEYEELKRIEAENKQVREKPFSIYHTSKVSIDILNGVIVGGSLVILLAIIVGAII